MRLKQLLLAYRPRESTGSLSTNRFAFQHTWALCHLLRLHESDQEYVLILEYHDDIIVLDDEVDPQCVEFFQVKTRKGNHWTKKKLISTPTTNDSEAKMERCKPRSILGKLLDHCRYFPQQVKSLNIVSNVTFKIPLADAPKSLDRERFSLTDLADEPLHIVKEAIRKELGEVSLPWDKVYFITTGISITEHEKYGVGELAEFLEHRHPGGRSAVQPLFRTLCGELVRRARNEWHPVSFEELCQKKGISRTDLESFLHVADSQSDLEMQFQPVETQLTMEGITYREVKHLEIAWRRYEINRMDQSDVFIQTFRQDVLAVVEEVKEMSSWHTLGGFLSKAQEVFIDRNGQPVSPLDMTYLKGAILYEIKTLEIQELSSVNPQLAEAMS